MGGCVLVSGCFTGGLQVGCSVPLVPGFLKVSPLEKGGAQGDLSLLFRFWRDSKSLDPRQKRTGMT